MKFSIGQRSLASALDKISAATESKHQLNIYRSIKMTVGGKWVKLSATSPTMTAEHAFEVEQPNAPESVTFGVSQDLLSRIVHALPSSNIEFGFIDNDVHLKAANASFVLHTIPPDAFPPARDFESMKYTGVDMPFLLYSMSKVSYCRNLSADRPRFRCVYMDHEHFTATDGFRMSIFPNKLGFAPAAPIMLSSETVDRLQRLFTGCGQEGGIIATENEVILAQGGTQVAMRTLAETYPQYKSVLPKSKATKVIFERKDLLAALRRTLIVAEKDRSVDLTLGPNGLSVFSASNEVGSAGENVYCDVSDFENMAVSVNGDYVIDALRSMDQEKVALELRSPEVSLVLTDGEHINVIQPIRRD